MKWIILILLCSTSIASANHELEDRNLSAGQILYTKLGGKGALAARGITDFNSGMPAFDGVISDEDIWDILAFIKSTWPEREQDAQASRNLPH